MKATQHSGAADLQQVGWLHSDGCGFYVVGCCCEQSGAVPIYRANIWPYNQSCARCGRVLVAGVPTWPELYDGRNAA